MRAKHVAAAAFTVALVALVHYEIYTIPFNYSEITGIQRNPVVISPTAFFERMLTPKGLLQRPISVLSYMLNYAAHGDRVAGFHFVNLAIHCVNTALVYLLARDFFAAPLVTGLVFGLHPLATACVSQIFGRNYSLATSFLLGAFYCYLRWRPGGPLGAGRLAMLLALYLLAILTKQTLVMLPVVLAWYEIGARNIGLRAAVGSVTPSWRTAILAAAAALVGFEILVRYAVPLSRTATIPPATFVLSQIANAPVIARFYLLPYQTALIHDLYLYRGVAHVEVWTGLALIVAIAFVAYRWRARPAAWLLGALLICLVPTNSVLPKNEIVREWRLYPGLVFYALLVSQLFSSISGWLRARVPARTLRFTPHVAVVVYLAAFAHSDVLQNRVYQTGVGAWQQVLERYPYSADAMNNIGRHYFYQGRLAEAATYFQLATEAGPETSLYRYNLAHAYRALGDRETAQRHSTTAAELRARHGMRRMTLHYR